MNMGKKLAIGAAFAAMAVFAVAPAFAGVVSSNHDMIFKYTLGTGASKAGACSFCHIPHKAGGDKLWAAATTTGTGWRAETISNLCYSCHGTGTTYAGALELNPFGTSNKHGRTVATLTGMGDIATLPASVLLSGDGNLKCTSCHDVHSNDSRPFIKFVTAGTFNFAAHCKTCHPQRANSIGQETANVVNGFSQHPSEQVLGNTGDTDEGFQTTIAAQFSLVGGANGAGVGGWNLGGHRSDNTATGNMTCATCHAVHGDETGDYTSAVNGPTEVAAEITSGFNALTVMNPNPTTVSAAICTGCHTSAMPIGPGTLGVSHPIDTVSSTWSVTMPARPIVVGMKWGSNTGDVIVCQSCHDMHYAAPNTSLLRGTIDTPILTSNSNCGACHASSTMANHHPAGMVYTGALSPVTHTTAYNWTTYAFGTAGAAYSFSAGGIMDCGTCHGSQAHNNAGAFPGLVGYNATSEMCVDCHSTNPSQYTATDNVTTQAAGIIEASHYVGPVVTAGYARTAAWQTTGLTSKYVGAQTHIICESCHTLKLSGTISGPTTSDNTVRGTAVRASVGLLLERSGNNRAVYNTTNAGVAADMCTGCHGGSPTGGTAAVGTATHPTISMGMTTAASAGVQSKVTTNINSVSLIPTSNLVNCESCHRPHDAAAGSGALILEAVGTASTKVAGGAAGVLFDRATGNGGAGYAEEATFCNFCHSY